MTHPDDGAAVSSGLRRLFPLIVLVEALTITALYWFGRHFS